MSSVRWRKGYQPCSSGSDRPGIRPARRPCFTTANPSLGKPNTWEESKETPADSNTDRLFKIPENLSASPSTKPFSVELEAAFVLQVPRSNADCTTKLCENLQLISKAVVISSTTLLAQETSENFSKFFSLRPDKFKTNRTVWKLRFSVLLIFLVFVVHKSWIFPKNTRGTLYHLW